MDFLSSLNATFFIVFLSAGAAAITFIAFALPLLARKEKQARYKEVIEKKRRALFEQAREQVNKPQVTKQDVSAAQSVASLYKLQRIAGSASDSARALMLRAGVRDPMAPLIYLISRIVLPVLFSGFAILVMVGGQKEFADGTKAMVTLGAAVIGFFLPYILMKNNADKRQQEIALAFPDSLDMMLICVQGGIGIEAAINRIADVIAGHSEALAEELGILCAELGMMSDRKAAFQGFASRVGSGPARSFATAMLQAEQYGTSVSKALRVLADETRAVRMATAEQKAASLPPKLTVPMILFFLPVLFVVILGPAFLKGFKTH
ncbi:MAG: type II secretion system F family protein [Micavibrio sp.]|nr:type II secretion system F family protein [Micavibrio sp.]